VEIACAHLVAACASVNFGIVCSGVNFHFPRRRSRPFIVAPRSRNVCDDLLAAIAVAGGDDDRSFGGFTHRRSRRYIVTPVGQPPPLT
jgi:hypothetical protein